VTPLLPLITSLLYPAQDGYLKETKDDIEAGNIEKRIYEFGARFYLEVSC
jgi:hypothetical protein